MSNFHFARADTQLIHFVIFGGVMQKRLKRFSTKSDTVIKIAIESNNDLIEGYL